MPKKTNITAGWKHSLATLIKTKGKYTKDGHKVVSFATQRARRENLFLIIKEIRDELGFKLQDVNNIKTKHIVALIKHYINKYQKKELSAATIRNRLSHLRMLCGWIEKNGLVRPIEYYTDIPIKRTSTAIKSKAWTDNGVDPLEKIEAIRKDNYRSADALLLQLLFGLRTKESLLIKPHLADKGTVLIINHGAKGGKTRFITIDTKEQRELLNMLKSYIGLNESLIPNTKTYEASRKEYYRCLEKHGVSRKQNITAHGLRHQNLIELYEKVTDGNKTPVRGGTLHKDNPELDEYARRLVSEHAGHSRLEIASAYIGGIKTKITDSTNT